MIVANVSHTVLINCTCKSSIDLASLYFRLLWYHSILKVQLISTVKSTHLWPVLVGFHDFRIFQFQTVCRVPYVACVKRGSGKTYARSQSLSSESVVKYPHVGRRKIQIFPPPGEQDQSNALPQGQQRQSNPRPMPLDVNGWILDLYFSFSYEVANHWPSFGEHRQLWSFSDHSQHIF